MQIVVKSESVAPDKLAYTHLSPERIKHVSLIAKNVRALRRKNAPVPAWKKYIQTYRRHSTSLFVLTLLGSILFGGVWTYATFKGCRLGGEACRYEALEEFIGADAGASIFYGVSAFFAQALGSVLLYLALFAALDNLALFLTATTHAYDEKANIDLMREAMEALTRVKESDLQALEASELTALDDILSRIQFSKDDLDYNELRLSAGYLEETIKNLTR